MSVPVRQSPVEGGTGDRGPHALSAGDLGLSVDPAPGDPPLGSGGLGRLIGVVGGVARGRRSTLVTLGSYLATVFVLITFNFALPRAMPGGPIDALMVQGQPNYVQNDQTRETLKEYYHLDGSVPEQYGRYLKGLAHGDLGVSVQSNRAVMPELLHAVPWTFLLILSSTIVSVAIGIPAGVHSGWKQGKRVDRGLLSFFMALENVPLFVLGTVAFILLAGKLRLFPYGKGVTPLSNYHGAALVVDIGRHLALPALCMGLIAAGSHYLLMRSSMVNELGADYLLVGRAKGLRQRRLKYRYAGRNALLPVVTGIGLQVGLGITAVIFVERIFAYPGIGGYLFQSIGYRDYPAIQGSFLLLTLAVVTVNLLVDLLYRRIDPRTVA